jgi:hypothetical protein
MNVLFLHQNFPGQFIHVAQALKNRRGVRAMAITDAPTSGLICFRRYATRSIRAAPADRIRSAQATTCALRAAHERIYRRSSADLTITLLDALIGTAQGDGFSKSKRIAAVQA